MPELMDPALAAAWRDIVEWYGENAPERIPFIAGPAREEAIAAIESTTAVRLPEVYTGSLRLHNGGIGIHKYDYLSAEEVVSTWTRWKAQSDAGVFDKADVIYAEDGRIQPVWWHTGWIPVARDSGGNLLLIDTAPGPNGTQYQLLALDKIEGPSVSRRKDFATWVRSYAEDLKAGRYYVEGGDVCRR